MNGEKESSLDREYTQEEQWRDIFFDCVKDARDTLASTPIEEVGEDMKIAIVQELDQMCPYIGERVLASGRCIAPLFDEDGDFCGDQVIDTQGDFYNGTHSGVAFWKSLDDEDRLDIFHLITLEHEIERQSATRVDRHQYLLFMNMDGRIMLCDELESAINPTPDYEEDTFPKNPILCVEDKANELDKVLRSTEFRRKKRNQQKQLVDDIVTQANTIIGLRETLLNLAARHVYALLTHGEGVKYVPLNVERVLLSGRCLGVESVISQTLTNKAIRNDADMVDRSAGLCIVLEPNDETRQILRLPEEAVLYVPALQEMECSTAPA